jgi:hypothetical protein
MRSCLLLLAACGGAHAPAPIASTAPADSLGARLERARRDHGDLLLVTSAKSIDALTPDLEPVAAIAPRAGYHGQIVDGKLYAVSDRQLFHVDLHTGELRVDATLPELHHKCFDDPDPMRFIEDGLPQIDLARGIACVHIQDRNDNMMSAAIDYRIDLRTGASVARTTFAFDDCREPGETKEAATPCDLKDHSTAFHPEDTTPHSLKEIDAVGFVSSSHRWAYFKDEAFGEEGDYIYRALLMFDGATAGTFAITPHGLERFDLASARHDGKLPEGACYVPFEAAVEWLPHSDVLLVENCGDGTLVLHPGAAAKQLPGDAFVVY